MRFLIWCAALYTFSLTAQTYRISTAARRGDNGDGQQAIAAQLLYPRGIAVARDGTVYVSQVGAHRVRRIATNGVITTYAGTGTAGFSGDGGPAAAAQLSSPTELAIDQKGNLFILDSGNGRVRRVAPDGTIRTYAGNGGYGDSTNGPAVNLKICTLAGITLDQLGNLYLSEEDGCAIGSGHRIWKVDTSGNATIYAGDGSGAGVLMAPTEIAWDPAGNNLYIYDLVYIYRRTADGQFDTIAGSYSGLDHVVTGVPAKGSYLGGVTAMAADQQGNLYFSTGFGSSPSAIFVIKAGVIYLVTGLNKAETSGFDGDAGTLFFMPGAMAFNGVGDMYIADYGNHRIRRLAADTGTLTTIAGTRTLAAGSTAPAFQLGSTQAIAAASDGSLYFADFAYAQVRRIAANGSVTAAAGNGFTIPSGDGGAATSAGLGASLNTIALDAAGNLYLHSYTTFRLRKVGADGTIKTFAGNGVRTGPVGDVATLAADASGTVYFSDTAIRRTSGGAVTSVYPGSTWAMAISPAGGTYVLGSQGVYRIDGDALTLIPGTNVPFPYALTLDPAGNLYIGGSMSFQGNGAIWRMGSDGVLRRIAGALDGPESPDGTTAANAAFGIPYSLAADGSGNVYAATISEIKVLVPDTGSNCSIRLASVTADAPASGGDATIAVTASGYFCPYGVTAQAPWIKPAVAGAAGSGPVVLHIDANTGAARQGTVSIGALTVTVRQPGAALTITSTAALPSGNSGAAYSATLTANGGAPPYAWSIAAGTLPDGVTLSAAGTLSGTPTAAGAFAFTVRVTDSASATATQANTLTIATSVAISAIVNAAGAQAGPVAPGELVVLYGSGIGPAQLAGLSLNAAGLVDTQLSGTSVLFDGIAAPMIYASAGQLAAVVPYATSNARPQVVVRYKGQSSAPFALTLTTTAPAIFTADATGKGQAAALNQDGSYNDAAHPAPAGSTLTLFATGEGQTTPAGIDGKPAAAPLPKPALPVSVQIGGVNADVVYAGGAPGEVAGVMQLNVRVPAGLAAGSVPIVVQVGTATSRLDVTIAIGQ